MHTLCFGYASASPLVSPSLSLYHLFSPQYFPSLLSFILGSTIFLPWVHPAHQ